MAVLLDTNVLSEVVRPRPNQNVLQFLEEVKDSYLSVVTLHELYHGAALVKDGGKRERLLQWVHDLEVQQESKLLPVSADIARIAAHLRSESASKGRVLHIEDALIAATAEHHELIVATRNIKDFDNISVELINPWDA